MKKINARKKVNARVCVPVILILIGITCIAYGTWSWAGATAWCNSYDDGWGIAHGSVGWGGMANGSWTTSASVEGWSMNNSGNVVNSGGGSSHVENNTDTAGSHAWITGIGNDGEKYTDSDSDSFDDDDCNWCNGNGCSSCD